VLHGYNHHGCPQWKTNTANTAVVWWAHRGGVVSNVTVEDKIRWPTSAWNYCLHSSGFEPRASRYGLRVIILAASILVISAIPYRTFAFPLTVLRMRRSFLARFIFVPCREWNTCRLGRQVELWKRAQC
jgi:hypothetical protein